MISDSLIARDLKLTFRDQKFILNGLFINFPDWLAGKPVKLTGSADLACDKLMPELLFPESSDTASENITGYHFPGDVIMDLKFKIKKLIYKTFEAENIDGELNYKPRVLNFKSLNLNSMEGSISGNGFVVQNSDKSFIGRGNFYFD